MSVRRAVPQSATARTGTLTAERRWHYSGWFDYPRVPGMQEFMDAVEFMPVEDRIKALDTWLDERGLLDPFRSFMDYMTKVHNQSVGRQPSR